MFLLILAFRIFTLDGGEFFKEYHLVKYQGPVTRQLPSLSGLRSLNGLHVSDYSKPTLPSFCVGVKFQI